jgi:hypothetical protein
VQSLIKKWNEIHEDWSCNVTRIYGRPLFHQAFDVVAHSILKFNFQGTPVTRGWVEGLLAGDTKCGKSEVAEKMTQFLGISKPIICEAATFAGVVGGVKDVGGKFSITWGALPRLDRRMAVLDETTGLTPDQISQMSGMRSSGVAQLVKIEAERALARVRKLWISNPRTDRNRRVSTYPFGVLCIPEIIGRAEDISRFDFAQVASSEEVSLELLNAKTRPTVKHRYTAEAAKALLYWAWSRTPEQVLWHPGTEDMVLDLAIAQCRSYSSSVPLVEPGEQRYRVARIAVALAARFHSTDSTGQCVVVRPDHVALAGSFLDDCYRAPACGYWLYSKAKSSSEQSLTDDQIKKTLQAIEHWPNIDIIMDAIALGEDLQRLSVVEYNKQAQLMAELTRLELLEYQGGKLQKTRKFVDFYRRTRASIGAGKAAF